MDKWEKIEVVQIMQDYIKKNIEEDNINLNELYSLVGYSQRHANRIFKELLGKTLFEYIKAIRMTESTKNLLKEDESILNIALDTKFQSHEGYTRAFTETFGVTPNKYRKEKMPIPLFLQYPIKHYYSYLFNKEISKMSKEREIILCMVTVVSKPKRKLLIMRSKKAHDYWTFCEEKGCQWEGLFNSINCKLDTAAIIELPPNLVIKGTTNCAAGIEVPMGYNGGIPAGCECIELSCCDMMYFQSEPFQCDDDFGVAINSVSEAIEKYDSRQYGYEIMLELAPKFNYGASKEIGAKQSLPVRKI